MIVVDTQVYHDGASENTTKFHVGAGEEEETSSGAERSRTPMDLRQSLLRIERAKRKSLGGHRESVSSWVNSLRLALWPRVCTNTFSDSFSGGKIPD